MTLAEFINKVGFKVKDEDVQAVNKTIQSIKSTATKALGLIGIGISLTQLNAIAEEFNGINDKLNYALEYSEDMKDVQKEILAAANDCKVSYANMVDTVVALKQANAEVFPIEEAATFVEYLNKLGKSAGYSDGEISSMQSSIQRVVAAGTMGAADITRIARTTPALIEKICEGLGVTREELDKMADAGQITGATLKNAIMNSAASIDASFDRLDYSISDAMLNIRNQWGYFVDDLNATTGLSQTIAKGMVSAFSSFMGVLNRVRNGVVWLTDKLGGADAVLRLLVVTAGLLYAAFNLDKIKKGIQTISGLLSPKNLGILATIAAVVFLALLIEDFINFMQGNDSLIGEAFKKAGIDADKFRENVAKIWEKLKTILGPLWEGITKGAKEVFGGIIDFVSGVLEKIAPFLDKFIEGLASGDIDTDKWVRIGETIVKIGAAIVGVVAAVKLAIGVVKTASAVIKDVSAAVKGASAVISFLTSPVGLVITAIIALIAIGVLLWKNWDKIKEFAISIWTSIKDFIAGILTGIKDFFVGIWESICGFISGVWTGITSTVSGALAAIWDAISSIFGVIWEFISGIATSIWEAITTAFENILTAITTTVGNIKDTIVDGFQAAIDWITSLPAQALQWGADIIQGIVDGITGAVGKVVDAVSNVAGKIKSFLGFSEPEDGPLSDFHTYMPDMIDLMTHGIQKGREAVKNAISDLTGDMSNGVQDVDVDNGDPDPKPKPKPKPSPVGTGGGTEPNPTPKPVGTGDGKPKPDGIGGVGAFFGQLIDGMKVFANAAKPQPGTVSTVTGSNNVSRSVVLNVEMNNKFEGDSAIQKKAAGAMDQSAKDITSELSRGLAYAK